MIVFPNLAQAAEQLHQSELLVKIEANQRAAIAVMQMEVSNQQSILQALSGVQNVLGRLDSDLNDIAKLDTTIIERLSQITVFIEDVLHPHLVSIGIVPGTPTTH